LLILELLFGLLNSDDDGYEKFKIDHQWCTNIHKQLFLAIISELVGIFTENQDKTFNDFEYSKFYV
jgi:hypothetical protein